VNIKVIVFGFNIAENELGKHVLNYTLL